MALRRNLGWWREAQFGYPLLFCFVTGLLAGSAMLLPYWNSTEILVAMLGGMLSAAILYGVLSGLLLRGVRADLARGGAAPLRGAALKLLRRADHVLVDDPMVLRREGRCLAARQPHLDPRFQSLLLALAQNSAHPLAQALAQSLKKAGVVPDTITNVDVQGSGQVNAEWRGHQASLFSQPVSYGDLTLSMHLRMDGQAAATVVFDEDVRADALAMVKELKSLAITPMLYGTDRAEMLGPMARQLGLMVQGCRDDDEKMRAVQRHLAAGHVPLILSTADTAGEWALRAGDGDGPVLRGDALLDIPTSIAAVREFYGVRNYMMRAILISHLIAFSLVISGLPSLWVWLSAWAVCGLSVRHLAQRRAVDAQGKWRTRAEGAAI